MRIRPRHLRGQVACTLQQRCVNLRVPNQKQGRRHRRRFCRAEPGDATSAHLEPVDKVLSAKLVFGEDGKPAMQYLARWKDNNEMTWEPKVNLSEDLLRDFEEQYWQAVKNADSEFLDVALLHGGPAVANIVDGNRRAALHFAAALNQADLVDKFIKAGADVNAADRDGYTPLHMAAGYLHNGVCTALLAAGADATIKDRQGRDIPGLLDSLRDQMKSASAIQNRMRLEEVSKALVYFTYEDVAPAAVLDRRRVGGQAQYLVAWRDDAEDAWVPAEFVSDEIIADYEAGLEYAEAVGIKDSRRDGDAKEYLVQWSDGSEDTWESEDYLTRALVAAYERGESVQEQQASKEGHVQQVVDVPSEDALRDGAGEKEGKAELAGVGQ